LASTFSPQLATLIALRVLGLVVLAPGLGSRVLPWRFRAAFTALVTLLLLPSQSNALLPRDTFELAWWGTREVLIGFAIGAAVRVFVAAAQWAGLLIGNSVGLAHGEMAEESEASGAPLVRIMAATGLAVYFAIGGHRQLIAALLESYGHFPIGPYDWPRELWPGLVASLGHSASWGLRVAAPALVAVFAATLVAGVVSRVLPQLEIISWTATSNTLIALCSVTFSLGAIGSLFPGELEWAWDSLRAGWRPRLP